MAVYKIFPQKDATIYSAAPTVNTGLDQILEVSRGSVVGRSTSSARALLQFPQDQIQSVAASFTGSFSASLQIYLADAVNLTDNYDLEVFPVYQEWDMGLGKYGQSPADTVGVSWANSKEGVLWQSSGLPVGVVTASHSGSSYVGGNWYATHSAVDSYSVYDVKDVNIDVTEMTKAWLSGSITNNGLILKMSGSTEFETGSQTVLQYFSRDTNTIYPPSLNIKWDDSVYQPVSQSFICTNSNINLSLQEVPQTFDPESVSKVRLSVREKYPIRTFSTSSLATQLKYLPSSSYWSLIDYKTKDIVVDFDTNFTKVSADNKGNYFTLHMNGLEPSRYYQVLIKSVIGPETVIFKENLIFKVE